MAKVTDAQYALVYITKAAQLENCLIQIAACTGDDYELLQKRFIEYAKNVGGDPIQLAAKVSRLAALGHLLPWNDPCAEVSGSIGIETIEHVYGG